MNKYQRIVVIVAAVNRPDVALPPFLDNLIRGVIPSLRFYRWFPQHEAHPANR
jgi:hypothetical protein